MSKNAGRQILNAAGQRMNGKDGKRLVAFQDQATGTAGTGILPIPYTGSGSCVCCCFCDTSGTRGYDQSLLLTIDSFNTSWYGDTMGDPGFYVVNSLPINDTFCLPLFFQGQNYCVYRYHVPGCSLDYIESGTGLPKSSTDFFLEIRTIWGPSGTSTCGLIGIWNIPDFGFNRAMIGDSTSISAPLAVTGIDCDSPSDLISQPTKKVLDITTGAFVFFGGNFMVSNGC